MGTIVAVVLTSATAAQAGSDGLNGRIAFQRETGGLSDIYLTVRPVSEPPAGEEDPLNVTPGTPLSSEADPSWAPPTDPDGDNPLPAALAFESKLGGDQEIYTLEPDAPALAPAQFTDEPGSSTDPAWAPEWPLGDSPDFIDPADDRPPIAFVRGGDVYVKSFDRDVETNVTADGSGAPAGQASNPDWSPDGRHITYESVDGSRHEIWVFRLAFRAGTPDTYESSDFRPVTPGHPPSFRPSWFFFPQVPADLPPPTGEGEGPAGPPASPDEDCSKPPPPPPEPPAQCNFAPADRILFSGQDPEGDLEIFFATYEELDFERPYADADHTTYWVLTENTVRDDSPAWSALGDRIVFERDAAGQSRLHVMDQDGEAAELLAIQTPPGSHDRNAAWEPRFNLADVDTRRPCGRFSNRPRCKRARIATVCRAGDPPPCPQPPECVLGDPPPCPQPPECVLGDPPPCPQPPECVFGDPPPCPPPPCKASDPPPCPPPPCKAGDPPPCPQKPQPKCTWRGTEKSETKRGTAGRDVLCGEGGNDRLIARGGPDLLRGGAGTDRLDGGPGNDHLLGQAGADRLRGGAGADRGFGGSGGDRLAGGPGPDRLFGGAGGDRFNARDRRPDTVAGGSGRDTALVDPADILRQIESPR